MDELEYLAANHAEIQSLLKRGWRIRAAELLRNVSGYSMLECVEALNNVRYGK